MVGQKPLAQPSRKGTTCGGVSKTTKVANLSAATAVRNNSKVEQLNRKSTVSNNDESMNEENNNNSINESRLDPIKFLINDSVSKKYSNQIKLANEIERNFPNVTLSIKFAYILGRKITIVTDDSKTHNLINNTWPTDAFEYGIKKLEKNDKSKINSFKVNLLNVHQEIDISEPDISDLLLKQGISNAKRIMKRNCGSPTNIISAEVNDRATYDKVTNMSIYLGYSRIRVYPKYGIKQCFRCFEIGHLKFECKASSISCMICSKNHHSDKCPTPNDFKCANCGGNHCSVSRKCSFLRQENKTKPVAFPKTSHVVPELSYAQATVLNEPKTTLLDEEKITELIKKILNETLNSNLESIIKKAIIQVMDEMHLKKV